MNVETVMTERYPKSTELARWFGIPLEKVTIIFTLAEYAEVISV
ncbi:arsenic metallochaperone ArsD family protein [Citrobacter cronae]|nr:arsenic metallochaperone ArsD family protein [Citrobacter cronae]